MEHMITFTILKCLLLTFCYEVSSEKQYVEADIIRDLFERYDARAYPNLDIKPVDVGVAYYLQQIQGLDEKEQTLTTIGSLGMDWMDGNLAWYNAEMKRIFVELDPKDIWKPSIIVRNSVLDTEDISKIQSTNARCYQNGNVQFNVFLKLTTFCPMNLRYFPFDKHICKIQLWHSSRWGINITNQHYQHVEKEGVVFKTDYENPPTNFLQENDEWDLLNLTLNTDPFILEVYGNDITYPSFEIIFELQRKPSFYVMILMLPSALVTLISMIGFLLPSESGEKVSLQLTALLSYMFLFLVVVDIIPPVGGNFPLIAQILIAGQITSTLNLLLTVIFLGMFHHQPPTPVPIGLKYVVFRIIAPMTLFNVKAFDNVNTENVVKVTPVDRQSPVQKLNQVSDVKDTNAMIMEMALRVSETMKQQEDKDKERNTVEWQILSRVLDRLFFILNLIGMTIALVYGYITLYTY